MEGGNIFIDHLLQLEKSDKDSGTQAFYFHSGRLMKDTVSLQPCLAYVLISDRTALVLQVNLNPLKLKEVTSLLEEGGQRHGQEEWCKFCPKLLSFCPTLCTFYFYQKLISS